MTSFKNSNLCDVTYADVIAACDGDPYTMSLVGGDAKALVHAVNMGIDSHLEACSMPDRGDSYVNNDRMIGDKVVARAIDCVVSPESLPVLLRRLFEDMPDEYDEDNDSLFDLGSNLGESILYTLGFRDCGHFHGRPG
ncbi:MAG: hypothetical protein GY759_09030 [Chloroflexi bacterium]|nr:hypothetical protein [Chloroflexota bacterium]